MDLSILDGHQFPASTRLVTRLRECVVLDMPSADAKPKPLFTRMAVILDKSADPRVFGILLAFHYQCLKYRVNLIALGKVDGRIQFWYGDKETFPYVRRPLEAACLAAFWPTDKIGTHDGILVPMIDGLWDRDNSPNDDLLKLAVPERYKLGLQS